MATGFEVLGALSASVALSNTLVGQLSSLIDRYKAYQHVRPLLLDLKARVLRIKRRIQRYEQEVKQRNPEAAHAINTDVNRESNTAGVAGHQVKNCVPCTGNVFACFCCALNETGMETVPEHNADTFAEYDSDVDFIRQVINEFNTIKDDLPTGRIIIRVKKTVDNLKSIQDKLITLERRLIDCRLHRDGVDEIVAACRDSNPNSPADIGDLLTVPSLSPYFVGREQEYRELLGILHTFGSVAIMQFGGVGKTQLMVMFAKRVEMGGLVPGGLFWIRAHGNRAQILSSFADFAERLVKKKLSEDDKKDVTAVVSIVTRKLSSIDGRWLMCIDNADDLQAGNVIGEICRFVEQQSVNGWVVVTSRQGAPVIWTGMSPEQKITLQPLAEQDAMAVLWRWKHSKGREVKDDEEVSLALNELEKEERREYLALQELAGDKTSNGLGGLSLALTQAGSYIQRMEVSFSEYVELYQQARASCNLEQVFREIEELEVRKDQGAIWTTWKINLDTLDDEARRVLRTVAVFGTELIPETLIKAVLSNCVAGSTSVDQLYLDMVKEQLVNGASLLQLGGLSGCRMFSLHRLLQQFVISDAQAEDWQVIIDLALQSLHDSVAPVLDESGASLANPPDVISDDLRILGRHVFSALLHASKRSNTERTYTRCCSPFRLLQSLRRLFERRYVADLVSDELDRREESSLVSRSELFFFAISVLLSLGHFGDAGQIAFHLLRILRNFHGNSSDNTDISHALQYVAISVENMGQLGEAEKWYRKSLEMDERIHGSDVDHPDIATSIHNLASLLEAQGKLKDAEMLYRKSLEMEKRIHGADVDHPSIATSIHNLASVLKEQGRLEDSEMLYRKSLEMNERIHGSDVDHPSIAVSLGQFASLLKARGKLTDAEVLYRKSIEMEERIHGADVDHPSIATSIHNLASLLEAQGKLEDAEMLYRKSIEMNERIHGSDVDHPSIAGSLGKLASVLEGQGKLKDAEMLYRKSIEMQERIHGADVDHPDIATSIHNLASLLEAQGKLEDAEMLYRKSLEMDERIHGSDVDHPNIAVSLGKLASVLEAQGKLKDA